MRTRARPVTNTTHNRHSSGPFFKALVVPTATMSTQSQEPTPSCNQFQAAFCRRVKNSETKFVLAALTCNYPIPGPNLQMYLPRKTGCPCAGIWRCTRDHANQSSQVLRKSRRRRVSYSLRTSRISSRTCVRCFALRATKCRRHERLRPCHCSLSQGRRRDALADP